jgi:hypothetical protein
MIGWLAIAEIAAILVLPAADHNNVLNAMKRLISSQMDLVLQNA